MTARNAKIIAIPMVLAVLLVIGFSLLDDDSASDERAAALMMLSFFPRASSSRPAVLVSPHAAGNRSGQPSADNDSADDGVYREIPEPAVLQGRGGLPALSASSSDSAAASGFQSGPK